METNEMTNDVINFTEEVTKKTSSGKTLKVAGGVGVAVLAAGLAYELLIKPAVAKKKEKEAAVVVDAEEDDEAEFDDVEITA